MTSLAFLSAGARDPRNSALQLPAAAAGVTADGTTFLRVFGEKIEHTPGGHTAATPSYICVELVPCICAERQRQGRWVCLCLSRLPMLLLLSSLSLSLVPVRFSLLFGQRCAACDVITPHAVTPSSLVTRRPHGRLTQHRPVSAHLSSVSDVREKLRVVRLW